MADGFRRFAAATCAIEAAWSTTVSSGDTWKETGIRWTTNNGPSQMANASGMLGVQKPGISGASNPHTAATEKIVADLAYKVGLPVPPVTLWDRGAAADDPRFVAISAWAFQQPFTWAQIETLLTHAQRQQLIRPASAMIPFEVWINADDRHNAGNVLVGFESEEAIGAWIDYAFSLDYLWKGNVCPGCAVTPMYPQVGVADTVSMKSTADRIAAVDSKTIEEIINRVPSGYLPRGVADNIILNLLARQTGVRSLWP